MGQQDRRPPFPRTLAFRTGATRRGLCVLSLRSRQRSLRLPLGKVPAGPCGFCQRLGRGERKVYLCFQDGSVDLDRTSRPQPQRLGPTVLCCVWGALCGAGCLAAPLPARRHQHPYQLWQPKASAGIAGPLGVNAPWFGDQGLGPRGLGRVCRPHPVPYHWDHRATLLLLGHGRVTWGATRAQCLGESDVQGLARLSVGPRAAEAWRGPLLGDWAAATSGSLCRPGSSRAISHRAVTHALSGTQ